MSSNVNEWLRVNSGKNGRLTKKAITLASRTGRLDVLKWVRENHLDKWSASWINGIAGDAIVNGQVAVLGWLYDNGEEWKYGAQMSGLAAQIMGTRQFELLCWLDSVGGDIDATALRKTFKHGMQNLLQDGECEDKDERSMMVSAVGQIGGDVDWLRDLYKCNLDKRNHQACENVMDVVGSIVGENSLVNMINCYAGIASEEIMELVSRY